jgi:hypothetical protein
MSCHRVRGPSAVGVNGPLNHAEWFNGPSTPNPFIKKVGAGQLPQGPLIHLWERIL